MRQRQANREAVEKTIFFLTTLFDKCIHNANSYTISQIHELSHVSKSTGTACIQLEIIRKISANKYEWIGGIPTKEMALKVLEALRLKADRTISVPLAGFEAIQTTLTEISEKITNATENNNNGLHRIKTPQKHTEVNGHNLFSEVDKKQDDLIKIVSAIAGGVFKCYDDLNAYEALNHRILTVSQDLLTKIYNK